jgi:hypothetical protein
MQLAREVSPPPGLRLPQAELLRKSNQIARGRIRRFESDMPSQAVRLLPSVGEPTGRVLAARAFGGVLFCEAYRSLTAGALRHRPAVKRGVEEVGTGSGGVDRNGRYSVRSHRHYSRLYHRCRFSSAMTGKNRIMIYGPKDDGTYVVEFMTRATFWRSRSRGPRRTSFGTSRSGCPTGCSCRR